MPKRLSAAVLVTLACLVGSARLQPADSVAAHIAWDRLDPALQITLSSPNTDPDTPISALVLLGGPTAFDLWQAERGSAELLAAREDGAAGSSGSTDPAALLTEDQDLIPLTLQVPSSSAHEALARERIRESALGVQRQQRLDAIYDRVDAEQALAEAFVLSTGANLISRYDSALNGFLVHATPRQLLRLSMTPGLAGIHRAPWYFAQLEDAVPMIGAETVQNVLGLGGKEVNVAVIDTGIDYTHRNLGGSGRPDEYFTNDPDRVEGRAYPNRRVVGGYDFAGTGYGSASLTPQPDDDPLDEVGHGTHVAGIIGGGRGNAKVHAGVAPDVSLVALKVFGRAGGTDLAVDAIEWAIEANLGRPVKGRAAPVDVINMSLGANWSYGVGPDSDAVRRATEAGIVVVASAGNAGNAPFVSGAPAAAPYALSVASTFASGELADAIIAITDNDNQNPVKIEALEADPGLAKTIREVKNLRAPLAFYGTGCNDATRPDVTGKVALIRLGTCPEKELAENAKKSGAFGIVAYGGPVFILGLGNGGRADVDIPAVMVEAADGDRLKADLDAGHAIDIVYGTKYLQSLEKTYLADVISSFSSRGPGRAGGLKPNIAAPGSNIWAPYIASGDDGVFLSGTSMAGPIVAGSAALIVHRLMKAGLWHKGQPGPAGDGLSPMDVGALLINTAGPTVWKTDQRLGIPVPLARSGAGRVDVLAAAKAQTIVRGGPIAGLDFGIVAVTGTHRASAPVTIRNLATTGRHYRLSTKFRAANDDNTGVTLWPEPAEVDVPAGGVVTATVHLSADAAKLKEYTALGGAYAMGIDDDRLADAEHDADLWVSESEASDEKVRLPIYVLPRGVAGVSAAPSVLPLPASGSARLELANNGGQPGRAELFTLLATDSSDAGLDGRLDIDYVGARVIGSSPGRFLDVLVHTRAPRRVPYDAILRVILDTNGDGTADWVSYHEDLEDLLSGGQRPSGRQTIFLRRITRSQPLVYNGRISVEDGIFADVNLNSRTVLLRIVADAIELPEGEASKLGIKVWLRTEFDDVAGGEGRANSDVVPDGAVTNDEQGRPQLAGDWLWYDPSAQAFRLVGEVSRNLPAGTAPGQGGAFTIAKRQVSSPTFTKLLVSFPLNAPDATDLQIIQVVDAGPSVSTPTPTRANATRTPPPTADSGETPVPTRPTPVEPTPTAPLATGGRIHLPYGLTGR